MQGSVVPGSECVAESVALQHRAATHTLQLPRGLGRHHRSTTVRALDWPSGCCPLKRCSCPARHDGRA